MVKVKTISRNEEEWTRQRPTDLLKVHRNIDPKLHPFERAREYTRALNATKLDKVFAKPFVSSLEGHMDGVFCLTKHYTLISNLISGSCDGEIRMWNIPFKTCIWKVKAHEGIVRGIVCCPLGDRLLSCGNDKTIKLWNIEPNISIVKEASFSKEEVNELEEPITTYFGEHMFTGIDHQRDSNLFATSGVDLLIWDRERSKPINKFSWGLDSVMSVKFNPIEKDILCSTATDRSVALYDLRGKTPVRKLIMAMKTNTVSWNPMEAFHFTLANEDNCLYTFDMRKLDSALFVHKDHLGAVLDVDYSPTGKEFVSGSYDRTLRIFESNQTHSREVYHTKRMQRIFSVKFSGDGRFIFCGSDDTNIRIWKAQASQPLIPLLPREKQSLDYSQKLKEKFQFTPEIKRIKRHRHLPKSLLVQKRRRRIQLESIKRKISNVRKHSKPGTIKKKSEKKKNIVEELK